MSGDPVLAALARLEGKVDRLEGKVDRLEDGQTRLRVDVMERMDRLQERADAIDGLLTMGLGHADEAHEQARAATESNRIHVEQIRTLRDLFRKLDSRVRQLEEKR